MLVKITFARWFMYLPKDPEMLLSVVNTALRDKYPSLYALCDDEDISIEELTSRLENAGYYYNDVRNAFVYKKG